MNYHPPFVENECYHVFNHVNGKELLFRNQDNYEYFLQQFKKYILPIADLYAYNLLPNHYHLVLQIKAAEDIQQHYLQIKKKQPEKEWLSAFVSHCFGNWQNSYAKAFNKYHHRMGSLFMNAIRRVKIENDHQFASTIFYTHKNAVHHGLCTAMKDWKFSSFHDFYSQAPSFINRNHVLNFFGDLAAFDKFHQQPIKLKSALVIEREEE